MNNFNSIFDLRQLGNCVIIHIWWYIATYSNEKERKTITELFQHICDIQSKFLQAYLYRRKILPHTSTLITSLSSKYVMLHILTYAQCKLLPFFRTKMNKTKTEKKDFGKTHWLKFLVNIFYKRLLVNTILVSLVRISLPVADAFSLYLEVIEESAFCTKSVVLNDNRKIDKFSR